LITITRRTAHRVRAVVRRALGLSGGSGPSILFQACNDHLRVCAASDDVVVEYRCAGDFDAEQVWGKAPAARTQLPGGSPEEFLLEELGRAAPYGVYDIAANTGWVNVGMSSDTASFAVESIRRWWRKLGRKRYPMASRLYITADGGGSNGVRVRLWKRELQVLASETGLEIVVSHLPPGTSKWNKIEHRLFSFISQNWRARPLVSYQTIVQLIAGTTTSTGLKVHCELDTNVYPKGIVVSDEEMAAIHITRDDFHGDWNYTISPNQNDASIV